MIREPQYKLTKLKIDKLIKDMKKQGHIKMPHRETINRKPEPNATTHKYTIDYLLKEQEKLRKRVTALEKVVLRNRRKKK